MSDNYKFDVTCGENRVATTIDSLRRPPAVRGESLREVLGKQPCNHARTVNSCPPPRRRSGPLLDPMVELMSHLSRCASSQSDAISADRTSSRVQLRRILEFRR
jgi:hypothetical protein